VRRGDRDSIQAHLTVLTKDVTIGATKTRLHCYHPPVDVNGRVRVKPLVEFLLEQITNYAIPRRTINEALRRAVATKSSAPIAKLHEQARRLFSNISTTGEGGEVLLFVVAEALFGFPQVLCKMSLKTSSPMHYHGSDGVYAEGCSDGSLNLYWGESKVYSSVTQAVRDCLESLAPFLIEPPGQDAVRERDILLINEFANLDDPALIDGLKRFLDRDHVASHKTRHCGIALIAFDGGCYPSGNARTSPEAVSNALAIEVAKWIRAVDRRVAAEKLSDFDMHFVCIPLPSAEKFRGYFLKLLG
jgi:hypothetical protein